MMPIKPTMLLTMALSLYAGSPAIAQDTKDQAKDQDGDMPPPPPPPEDEGGGGGGGFHGPMRHMFKELGLSDAQKQKMDTIREAMRPKFKELMQQLGKERDELGQQVADQVGLEKARIQHKKIQVIADQLADQRFEMMYQIAGILTPDQRKKLHEMEKTMMKKGPRHHHPRD